MVMSVGRESPLVALRPGPLPAPWPMRITPATALSALLALLSLVVTWNSCRETSGGGDLFLQPYAVPRAVAALGLTNVYDPWQRLRIGAHALKEASRPDASPRERAVAKVHLRPPHPTVDANASPFFFAVFAPFSRLDFETFFEAYVALSLSVFVAALLGLGWLLRLPLSAALAAIALFPFLSAFQAEMRVLNVNLLEIGLLTLSLCLLALRYKAAQFGGGLALGLGVMFKPNIAFAVLLLVFTWICNRRWRKLSAAGPGIALGMLAAFAGSSLYFASIRCWIDFVGSLDELMRNPYSTAIGNYSLTRLVMEQTGVNLSRGLLALLMGSAMIAIWMARRPRQPAISDGVRQRDEDYLAVSIGVAVGLAASSLAWLHYYLLLIPLMLFPLRRDPEPEKAGPSWIVLTLVVLVMAAQMQVVDEALSVFDSPHFSAGVYGVSALLMVVIALAELLRLRPAAAFQRLANTM